MKNLKSPTARGPILNELILTLRLNTARRRRRVSVELGNCCSRDLPFMRAIAGVVSVWFSRTLED